MDQQSGIDPADQWVFDPATGSYQLRLDGAGAAPRHAPRYAPAAVPGLPEEIPLAPSPAPHPAPSPAPHPAPSPAPAARTEGRAAARGRGHRRRVEQRRAPKGRIPVWLGCTTALAIIGGGVGGYLLSGHPAPACTTATAAVAPPGTAPAPSPSTQAAADVLRGPLAAPIDVRVNVYDGTGRFGTSQAVLSWLQNTNGVTRSTNAGPAAQPVAVTTLDYAPNQADQARRLAKMMGLPVSALKEGTTMAAFRQPMTLTLGRDFTAPGQPFSAPAPSPAPAATHPSSSPHC